MILPSYGAAPLRSTILIASHHGSMSFFKDGKIPPRPYTAHMDAISPRMTFVSVGPNVHGFPDPQALRLYASFTRGSDDGEKMYTTEEKGNLRLLLKVDGSWMVWTHG